LDTRLILQLDQLERAGLIRIAQLDPEVEYLFRHTLVQEAAYDSLLKQDRRRLHRAVGETLERLYPDRLDELALVLGHHFAQAGDVERALHYLTRAGDSSAARYANHEAITLYSQALQIARGADRIDLLPSLYLKRGAAMELANRYPDALRNYEELGQVAGESGDRATVLASLVRRATIYAHATSEHDSNHARVLSEEALALARDLGDRATEASILWTQMMLEKFAGRADIGAVYGEQSLAIAREMNLREQLAYTLHDLGNHVYLDTSQFQRAHEVMAEARGLWIELGNQPMLADSLSTSALTYFLRGEFDQALAAATEARRISEAIGNLWGQSYSRWVVGDVYLERGQIDLAVTAMEECVLLGEQGGFVGAQAGIGAVLGMTYGLLGLVERGIEQVRRARATAEESLPSWVAWSIAALARLSLRAGDLAAAQAHIGAFDRIPTAFPYSILMGRLAEAEIALACRDARRALTAASNLLDYLHRAEVLPFRADALLLQARALQMAGQEAQARAALLDARAQAEALGSVQVKWQILLALARWEEAYGVSKQAAHLRLQARAVVRDILDGIQRPDLRAGFSALPDVRELLSQ